MKTYVDCLPCYLKQALRVARLSGLDETRQLTVVEEVAKLLPSLNQELAPPENSIGVYETISLVTHCADPYYSQKKQSNNEALALLPRLREEVLASRRPLEMALRLAIGGNVIDYGSDLSFNLVDAFERCRTADPVVNDISAFLDKVDSLKKGAEVLYLADNCGEIVYDSLVMERLAYKGFNITVAVKHGPIINDALYEDAVEIGLDTFCTVITNGTNCPGTPLRRCSKEFLDVFRKADLIISKGQGNFETLSEVEREIFFMLTVKCSIVGRHLAMLTGTEQNIFQGNGEMVVYKSHGK